ncbi:hypothetical protein SK069_06740 [Patulibacter brassicae]|uniref:DoxX family protein n=1 Tax=Patulibacter brassicae TaxID=1705717 RepID=A0ABU4VKG6_9ACTN|nr:hypothetical protein [Patulibacter brassicae]MDX8151280.1 hypothetical protein [Patulibacter brassicae]
MPDTERIPQAIAAITLVAGVVLVARPEAVTRPLGLEGQELQARGIGVSDLLLVPGLAAGRPRWPWMVGRAALSVAQATYLGGVAPHVRSRRPRAGAATLAALAVADAATALRLRAEGR